MSSSQIETFISKCAWKEGQLAIERQLQHDPDDHWLWCRLSGVMYEQRDYRGALEAADTARKIVPDCPLALWSCAGALEMLGDRKKALKVYFGILRRGLEEIKKPDDDAEECWEGAGWTRGMVMDCVFRIADCLAKLGREDKAVTWYNHFLDLVDFGVQRGIYSPKDVKARLNKLVANGTPSRERMLNELKELKSLIA